MFNRVHRFLSHRFLYPLMLSSSLAMVLCTGRIFVSGNYDHAFLIWNLILAWIPYLASLWAVWTQQHLPGRWWLLLPPAALWLSFFPNAPYIVTDLAHLTERPPVPLWFDVGMIVVFALAGLFLAVYSLRIMHRLVQSYVGSFMGWLFVLAVLPLGGFGVYLGRFLRWNSWDLILRPKGVLSDVALRLSHPWEHPRTMGVTLLFAAILLVCYLAIGSRETA